MVKHNTVNIGNAGEYFVAGELERRGFTVAVPMSNVKDFDILAINRETYEQFAIQVKTTGYKQKKWTLSQKNEILEGDNIIYILVSLNELDTPEYHIVPSKVVARTIREEHQKWLHTPGKDGQPHHDTAIRNFYDEEDMYLDKWDILSIKKVDDGKIPMGTYDSLTQFIPKLVENEYGKVFPERQTGKGTVEDPFQMPFYIYSNEVNKFVEAVYQFEEEHSEFELNKYIFILLKSGIKWSEEEMASVDVCALDGQTILALIMGAIRAERFCDGALNGFLKSGCILKWLKRLEELNS